VRKSPAVSLVEAAEKETQSFAAECCGRLVALGCVKLPAKPWPEARSVTVPLAVVTSPSLSARKSSRPAV
jgi:hypothetical protein